MDLDICHWLNKGVKLKTSSTTLSYGKTFSGMREESESRPPDASNQIPCPVQLRQYHWSFPALSFLLACQGYLTLAQDEDKKASTSCYNVAPNVCEKQGTPPGSQHSRACSHLGPTHATPHPVSCLPLISGYGPTTVDVALPAHQEAAPMSAIPFFTRIRKKKVFSKLFVIHEWFCFIWKPFLYVPSLTPGSKQMGTACLIMILSAPPDHVVLVVG